TGCISRERPSLAASRDRVHNAVPTGAPTKGGLMAAPLRSRVFVTALALMAVVPQACDAPRIDSPASPVPTFGKSSGGPAVNAANPASGHQGDVTLDVTITGSGFDSGSRASWQRNGVPDPKITVNSTRYNSATSLTANITIAADAVVATYDIAVI